MMSFWYRWTILFVVLGFTISCKSAQLQKLKQESLVQNIPEKTVYFNAEVPNIKLGIEKLSSIITQINNKKIGVFINHTSQLNGMLLHEILLKQGMFVKKIFTPEHGLKATVDAGEKVDSKVDSKTGLPIVSLYGSKKKPNLTDLKDVDLIIFDIQDVGTRFYTYISSLQYMMEACAENNKTLIVLDRPNPNGHFVDGPVLENGFESFVGMQRIPVIHGMTIGEYALFLKGQKLFNKASLLKLKIVSCDHYTHKISYSIPVFPSPNLRTDNAIKYYPALCFFEGTDVSVGRGTDIPFECFGSPLLTGEKFQYQFTPRSAFGAVKPMHENKLCKGVVLKGLSNSDEKFNKIPLQYLIDAYSAYRSINKQAIFFNSFFRKLAGTDKLETQIKNGFTENQIRASWKKDIVTFKKIRKLYLLYPDFE